MTHPIGEGAAIRADCSSTFGWQPKGRNLEAGATDAADPAEAVVALSAADVRSAFWRESST